MSIRINLLRPEKKSKKAPPRGLLVLAGIAAITLVGLLIYANTISTRVARLKSDLDATNQRITELRAQVADLERARQTLAAVQQREVLAREFLQAQMPAAEILSGVSENLPRDTWLSNVTVQGIRSAQIEGMSAKNDSIALMMVRLTESPLFQNVDLTVTERQRLDGRDMYKFTITTELESRLAGTQSGAPTTETPTPGPGTSAPTSPPPGGPAPGTGGGARP